MPNRRRTQPGFTLVEVMVAMIILSIGLLGFSGMSVMMATGTRHAQTTDEAATLMQSTIEDMSSILWDDLGTDLVFPPGDEKGNGLDAAKVLTQGPLNKNGESSGEGPFRFYRNLVVCTSADTTTGAHDKDHCVYSYSVSSLPDELACDTLGLTAREKMIRVMISWHDRKGDCHYKHTDSLAFQ